MSAHRPTSLILLVDDDPGARLLQSTALQAGGFHTVTANDGKSALDMFHNVRPDCLVLDVVMPGMNGYELCAAIRRLPEGQHLPILILTSLDDRDSISLAYAAGASDFAQKGIAPLLLVERVRFLLRAHDLQKGLLESEARLAQAQRIARTGHWEINLEGHTVSVSPVALELLELDPNFSHDYAALCERIVEADRSRLDDAVRLAATTDQRFGLDVYVLTPSGVERFVHLEGQMSDRTLASLERTIVITLQDLTDLRRAEERARQLEYFDARTRLPNLAFLRERLVGSLADADKETQIAAIVIDIERLNRVNDSLGAAAGDELLLQIGKRLNQTMIELQSGKNWGASNGPAVVARIGGDEFCVALSMKRRAELLSEALSAIQTALRLPFNVLNRDLIVSTTLGVAVSPDDASDAESLLRFADSAVHQAKQTQRGGIQFYSAKLQSRAAQRLSLENDLRHAIERDQLQLHYQPRVSLATFAPTGVEALLRWHHPDRGWVGPAEFVPIAEELGLIVDIGAWVLHEATRQAALWAKAGSPLCVAVNVSAVQFERASVTEQVATALRANRLPAHLLELEITEGILIERTQLVRETLEALQSDGIRIALDDFGTGYSSLSYLRQLPFDYLKIDRSFIKDLDGSNDGARLVAAILALAGSLGLRTVAEGVETHTQLQFLMQSNCNELQGYLIARPMPASAMLDWLAGWLKNGRTILHGVDQSTPHSAAG